MLVNGARLGVCNHACERALQSGQLIAAYAAIKEVGVLTGSSSAVRLACRSTFSPPTFESDSVLIGFVE
jgi:hypothetical protein